MAIRLLSELMRTERQRDGKRVLLRELVVQGEKGRIAIPEGFSTDFSSIPSPGRFLVRWSKVDIAGVVHDWLYYSGELPRREADRLWRLIAMSGQHRANMLQAWIAWLALWAVGWIAWNAHLRKRQQRSDPPEEELD